MINNLPVKSISDINIILLELVICPNNESLRAGFEDRNQTQAPEMVPDLFYMQISVLIYKSQF
jgi:hypothetical protein